MVSMCKAHLAVVLCVLLGPVSSQKAPKWLLVRSDAVALGRVSWERLAETYLRANYQIVRGSQASIHPETSRLVAGTPGDNALVQQLAGSLGIEFQGQRLRYDGRWFPDGTGLALVTEDPDGQGQLVLFVGATPEAAFNCLSVKVDMGRQGYVAMSFRKPLRRGKVVDTKALMVAGDRFAVVRLDRELWRIRDEFAGGSMDEAALRVSRALAGYSFLYARAVGPDTDLLAMTRRQFADPAMLAALRQRFAKVDFTSLLAVQGKAVARAVGGWRGPRPIVFTLVTRPELTNAQVIGADPLTGRSRMILNLAAFDNLTDLRLAMTHELVHTRQSSHDGTLAGRAVREGVATLLSQLLRPGTTDAAALMWDQARLAAAKQRRAAIVKEFRRLQDSRDMRRIGMFLYAGRPLRKVTGAPDRCGYYVGWLAAKAWRKQHREASMGDLLGANPAAVLAALDK